MGTYRISIGEARAGPEGGRRFRTKAGCRRPSRGMGAMRRFPILPEPASLSRKPDAIRLRRSLAYARSEHLLRPADGVNSLGLLKVDAVLGEPGQQVMAPGADEAASGEPGVIGDLGDRGRRREE
jgi:hypothetical protein